MRFIKVKSYFGHRESIISVAHIVLIRKVTKENHTYTEIELSNGSEIAASGEPDSILNQPLTEIDNDYS